ncbi:MAG: tRNA pseudouridine(55) synthase TruB [Gemmatimonadales bacterium]|nr:MAG: tRNA pseudouridine(55) synthase TruB [Gemmatimonadales bacterium]
MAGRGFWARRRRLGVTQAGLLLIDKPVGPSSHDVVANARRELGLKRIGHTGTLDPFASGLLLVCVGSATRLVEYFHVLPKTYEAGIVLGERRDTDDLTGAIVASSQDWQSVDRAAFEEAILDFEGSSEQRPPDYSARRQHGQRAYNAARGGAPLHLESRTVEVSDIRLIDWSPPRADVILSVSTGTYIRAIARDLGERLGCHAHLNSLRRTNIGAYHVSDSVPGATLARATASLVPPLDAVGWLRRRKLTEEELEAVRVGKPIVQGEITSPVAPVSRLNNRILPVALHAHGKLVAIGVIDGHLLRPVKVFHAA